MTRSQKGAATRARILEKALGLFRERGFDQTTMREVARAAELSTGAAYHYFPSKEALVLAYFAQTLAADERRLSRVAASTSNVRDRLGAFLHGKMRSLQPDRVMLGALFRRIADPNDPVGVFSPDTEESRRRAIATFTRALEPEALPRDVEEVVAVALWALHLAFLLFFIRDDSPAQERTHRLIDGSLDIIVPMILLAKQPGIITVAISRVRAVLIDTGLMSERPVEDPES